MTKGGRAGGIFEVACPLDDNSRSPGCLSSTSVVQKPPRLSRTTFLPQHQSGDLAGLHRSFDRFLSDLQLDLPAQRLPRSGGRQGASQQVQTPHCRWPGERANRHRHIHPAGLTEFHHRLVGLPTTGSTDPALRRHPAGLLLLVQATAPAGSVLHCVWFSPQSHGRCSGGKPAFFPLVSARLDELTATTWLRRWLGERGYQMLWHKLFAYKFFHHGDSISAAWIWSRIRRLGQSRQRLRETLGFLEGGPRP